MTEIMKKSKVTDDSILNQNRVPRSIGELNDTVAGSKGLTSFNFIREVSQLRLQEVP